MVTTVKGMNSIDYVFMIVILAIIMFALGGLIALTWVAG